MEYKRVFLKKGKEESLKRFHPWVFSGAIAKMDNGVEEGDIVAVYSNTGEFVAMGHFQIGSIMVRVLDFAQRDIDADFFFDRLQKAFDLRKSIGVISCLVLWLMSMIVQQLFRLTLRECTLPATL